MMILKCENITNIGLPVPRSAYKSLLVRFTQNANNTLNEKFKYCALLSLKLTLTVFKDL